MRIRSSEATGRTSSGRVALAARAATQLVVDAAAFVPFGGQDVEPAGGKRLFLEFLDLFADRLFARLALRPGLDIGQLLLDAHVGVAAELDVGAAAGHVGGDRDRAGDAGLRDDIGFLFVIAGVQHLELGEAALLQHIGEKF